MDKVNSSIFDRAPIIYGRKKFFLVMYTRAQISFRRTFNQARARAAVLALSCSIIENWIFYTNRSLRGGGGGGGSTSAAAHFSPILIIFILCPSLLNLARRAQDSSIFNYACFSIFFSTPLRRLLNELLCLCVVFFYAGNVFMANSHYAAVREH